jgi:GGDEF domain-containing protein
MSTLIARKFRNQQNDEIRDTVIDTPDGRRIRLVYKRSPDGGWATTLEDITERSHFEARIEHLAHYDALTDLPNRTLFQLHAEGMIARLPLVPFAIFYIDIDEFKDINDSRGHLIGDEFFARGGAAFARLRRRGGFRCPPRRRRIRHRAIWRRGRG